MRGGRRLISRSMSRNWVVFRFFSSPAMVVATNRQGSFFLPALVFTSWHFVQVRKESIVLMEVCIYVFANNRVWNYLLTLWISQVTSFIFYATNLTCWETLNVPLIYDFLECVELENWLSDWDLRIWLLLQTHIALSSNKLFKVRHTRAAVRILNPVVVRVIYEPFPHGSALKYQNSELEIT